MLNVSNSCTKMKRIKKNNPPARSYEGKKLKGFLNVFMLNIVLQNGL